MKKLRIIVGGFLGLTPAGGLVWHYAQFPAGLAEMGHDVFYIEDTRIYPIYQNEGSDWGDCSASVEHISNVMNYFRMPEKWAYRDEATGKCFGLSEENVKEIARTADVFINLSCSTFMRDEYRKIPARVLVDTDPMFTQIQLETEQMFTPGKPALREMVKAHNNLFTFGMNIGADDCRIPTCGFRWKTTRQPVCLKYWKPSAPQVDKDAALTTLMNWAAAKNLEYQGESWGQKDVEFEKLILLPEKVSNVNLAIAVGQTGGTGAATFPLERIKKSGWKILKPVDCAESFTDFQKFIADSSGEFSVAKETYIKGNTGWFSDRSACYLAGSRPVITQETGWSKYISEGEGLLSFTNVETAVEAIKKVSENPEAHSKKSRAIAEDFFDSKKVLGKLIEELD